MEDGSRMELTEEQREQLREKRRERRKKDKERKRKEKEEKKRQEIYAPKTSKIQFISPDILNKVTAAKLKEAAAVPPVVIQTKTAPINSPYTLSEKKSQTQQQQQNETKKTNIIRFMDEEYPDLTATGMGIIYLPRSVSPVYVQYALNIS